MARGYAAFRDDSGELQRLEQWWKGLEERKGARAALRRARRPDEVVFVPYYHELVRSIRSLDLPFRPDRLACLAGLASHLRDTTVSSEFPIQMAERRGESSLPRVREARFRRLLTIGDDELDELYETLRRVLRLLDDRASLPSFVRGVYWWGDKTRRDWAYAYYGAIPERRDQ